MTVTLYAQPYDMTAKGFFFERHEDFTAQAGNLRNSFGDPVEEFEIQLIDGDAIDCELAQAIGFNQANLADFLAYVADWDTWEKTCVITAVGECGYDFGAQSSPEDFGIDIYHVDSLRELAEQFVDEGLFGDIPEPLQSYIDYDAIARDLAVDYVETTVAGQRLVYRCS